MTTVMTFLAALFAAVASWPAALVGHWWGWAIALAVAAAVGAGLGVALRSARSNDRTAAHRKDQP